eukprot:6213101-Pleurochrysis_carterae.AAC.2
MIDTNAIVRRLTVEAISSPQLEPPSPKGNELETLPHFLNLICHTVQTLSDKVDSSHACFPIRNVLSLHLVVGSEHEIRIESELLGLLLLLRLRQSDRANDRDAR